MKKIFFKYKELAVGLMSLGLSVIIITSMFLHATIIDAIYYVIGTIPCVLVSLIMLSQAKEKYEKAKKINKAKKELYNEELVEELEKYNSAVLVDKLYYKQMHIFQRLIKKHTLKQELKKKINKEFDYEKNIDKLDEIVENKKKEIRDLRDQKELERMAIYRCWDCSCD